MSNPIVSNRDKCGRCHARHGGNDHTCAAHGLVSAGCCVPTHVATPDEETLGRDGHEICLVDDDVRGAIVHNVEPDCERLHGLRITEQRCSVCDQEWSSRHEGCADLMSDGSRRVSSIITYLADGRIVLTR